MRDSGTMRATVVLALEGKNPLVLLLDENVRYFALYCYTYPLFLCLGVPYDIVRASCVF